MPDPELDDVSLSDSSADTPVNPDPIDSAVNHEQEVPPVTETAVPDDKAPTDSEDVSPTQSAIDLLSGKKKVEKPSTQPKPVDKKTTEKPVVPEKPTDKKSETGEDPMKDFTPEERKHLSAKTEKRIVELNRKWKEAEARFEKDPTVAQGRAFAEVLDEFKLREHLPDLGETGDHAIAGSIVFHAALNRISQNRARPTDRDVVKRVFDSFDSMRPGLGMAAPTPAVDFTALEEALALTKEDFDLSRLEKLIGGMKAAKPTAPVAPQQVQQPVIAQQQPAQREPEVHPDVVAYSDMLADSLADSGIAADKHHEYTTKRLWPAVVAKIASQHPSENAVEFYNKLSPRAQYDRMVAAHTALQKQQAVIPPKRPTAPTTPRPVSGTGTRTMGGEAPGSPTKAAIQYLSGS